MSEATPSGSTETPIDPAPAEKGKQFAVLGVELNTPDGLVRGKVEVDTGPMRLSELVQTAYELTAVVATRANRQQEALGKSVSCRVGCAACCRQMVPLSPPEAFYLMDLIDGLDPIKRAGLLGRFEAIGEQLEAENMIQPMLDLVIAADESRSLNKQYFAMQVACPFLVEERCSIHHDRPVACREYSVTSPAVLCSDPFGNCVDKVPMPIPLSAPLSWLTAELVGGQPALIPLVLMPRWVHEHEDLRQRTWPGLELFRKFMEVAAGEGRKENPSTTP